MEEKQKFLGIMGFIALRKTELYSKILHELSKEGEEVNEAIKARVKSKIAEMDNERFLSSDEKRTKRINSNLSLEDIDFDIKFIKKTIEEK